MGERRFVSLTHAVLPEGSGACRTELLYAVADDGTAWAMQRVAGYDHSGWQQVDPLPAAPPAHGEGNDAPV